MHDTGLTTFVVVLAVLLFFGLGVAILIIMDHKARLPGGFKRDLLTISGMRRDHPVESFLTMTILMGIILALILSLLAALTGRLGFLKEEKKPQLLTKIKEERMVERTRHFHNSPEKHYADLGKKVVCFYCHGDYPHSKEPMIRTLMNMHTQFIGCMTCHADPRKIPEESLSFNWLNFSGIDVKGPPFGTSLDKNTGYLVKTDDYYSKIVAYTNKDGVNELLEMPEDVQEVQEFLAIRDSLNDKDREAIKKRFHKPVSPKGRFCSRCHTQEKESYLPFRKLGFSDRRVSDLTNLNIIGLVQKYKEFYMPNLLGGDKALPSVEALTGKSKADTSATAKELRKDPKAWWRQQYDTPATTPGK